MELSALSWDGELVAVALIGSEPLYPTDCFRTVRPKERPILLLRLSYRDCELEFGTFVACQIQPQMDLREREQAEAVGFGFATRSTVATRSIQLQARSVPAWKFASPVESTLNLRQAHGRVPKRQRFRLGRCPFEWNLQKR